MKISNLKVNSLYRFQGWNGTLNRRDDIYEYSAKKSGVDVIIQYVRQYVRHDMINSFSVDYPFYIFKMVSISQPSGFIRLWPFEVGFYVWPTETDIEVVKINDLYRI
jgi:hypothetical protein